MRVDRLHPLPDTRAQFAWSHHASVPAQSGCYALVTYGGDILYVGLATSSVRDRMGAHLNSPEKRKPSNLGTAFWFYYFLCTPSEVSAVELGWMNQAVLEDGDKPVLNKIYSPL